MVFVGESKAIKMASDNAQVRCYTQKGPPLSCFDVIIPLYHVNRYLCHSRKVVS